MERGNLFEVNQERDEEGYLQDDPRGTPNGQPIQERCWSYDETCPKPITKGAWPINCQLPP